MLDALIFDVDGTLAETEELHRAAFHQAFADRGLLWRWTRADYEGLFQGGAAQARSIWW